MKWLLNILKRKHEDVDVESVKDDAVKHDVFYVYKSIYKHIDDETIKKLLEKYKVLLKKSKIYDHDGVIVRADRNAVLITFYSTYDHYLICKHKDKMITLYIDDKNVFIHSVVRGKHFKRIKRLLNDGRIRKILVALDRMKFIRDNDTVRITLASPPEAIQ